MNQDALSRFVFRSLELSDLERFNDLARSTFTETFGHLYDAKDLEAFLNERFTEIRISAELADSTNAFRVIELDGELIGFAMIGNVTVPIPKVSPSDLELRRLYIRNAFQGLGLGRKLMQWAFDEFRLRGATSVYLSVYSKNDRAIRFYQQFGFRKVGEYNFYVGTHIDLEWIMQCTPC